ncbi:DUF1643 domain-containing protein [Arthrobacter crystallopoietes]|uniref:Uncharacterized protein n=1 Tax=Crystallibacter crystallopoietes TaxID=37928 RepID=A0A1H0XL82_9MICC|nr:DUF1643 domain-containing protein [Arthrobacter crystallopoietes]SDQ03700.1 Protein of unknown function [Arthrobacter crystallopoietes]
MTLGLRAVLFNPSSGNGARTVARVSLAAGILGYEEAVITNLFPLPTPSVLQVNEIGTNAGIWESARPGISETLAGAKDVLLAFGCQEPTGAARHHFRTQLAWLHEELESMGSRLWSVSERPRHPSRWQRHTSRQHPEMPFIEALERSLQRVHPHS